MSNGVGRPMVLGGHRGGFAQHGAHTQAFANAVQLRETAATKAKPPTQRESKELYNEKKLDKV